MANDDRIQKGILGDINPVPRDDHDKANDNRDDAIDTGENEQSMVGGSRHDRTKHSGSRDVTEGVTGGVGTETGGSRNYRSGSGATGGDIGNRPE